MTLTGFASRRSKVMGKSFCGLNPGRRLEDSPMPWAKVCRPYRTLVCHPFTVSGWTLREGAVLDEVMKRVLPGVVLLLVGIGIGFGVAVLLRQPLKSIPAQGQPGTAKAEAVTITISATIDGSERFIFTSD